MTTFTKRIAAGTDDVMVNGDGTGFQAAGSFAYFGDAGDPNGTREDGFRFTNITIPQGTTITSAKLTLVAHQTRASASCFATISCVDEDNFNGFSNVVGDRPNDVVVTTANTSWTLPSMTLDNTYDTPAITSTIQEVVNRGSWSSGNAIGVVLRNNASADASLRSFTYFETDSAKAALLTIEYTGASTFTPHISGII